MKLLLVDSAINAQDEWLTLGDLLHVCRKSVGERSFYIDENGLALYLAHDTFTFWRTSCVTIAV